MDQRRGFSIPKIILNMVGCLDAGAPIYYKIGNITFCYKVCYDFSLILQACLLKPVSKSDKTAFKNIYEKSMKIVLKHLSTNTSML